MVNPRVTVIMPVYNAGAYLRNAVLSIVSQTFSDWELLIIDDGSTDDALDTIVDVKDERIQVLRNSKNIGLAATLNVGINLARGVYFARMDQDDISYPERLARQVEMLDANPALDLIGVQCLVIDENNEVFGTLPFARSHQELCAAPWRGFYLPHPTWMGRLDWFRFHRYASPAPYLCEDQEILLRTYSTSIFATLPEVLFAYRIRTSLDFGKLRRTRKSVLMMQLAKFKKNGQLRYCILTFLTYLARSFLDVASSMSEALLQKGLRRHAVSLADDERSRFRTVLTKLEADGCIKILE